MRIELTITTSTGGEQKVVCGPAEFIRLERKYGVGMQTLTTSPQMEHLAFIAWSAMKREGTAPTDSNGKALDFDAFIDVLDDLDFQDDDDADDEAGGSGN